MKLNSNTILITGGASGIGLELAKQLDALGNTILVTGRDQAKLDRAKKELPKINIFKSDVSDPKSIPLLFEKVTKEFPDLNIIINNAGIMRTINVHDKQGSLEDVTQEIETNLSGPIRMVKQFLPHLKKKPNAAIMNVSSGLAFVPLPMSPVYCATKAGLHSFTLSLRVQLHKTNVKVFELAPPATQTDLLGDFDSQDMKGISIMKVSEMVAAAVKGMQEDRFEIRPGQSNQLKFMSRLAPQFILKQMSKPVDRMLAKESG
jgi:uncharacterized oxidoreductase